MTDHSLGPSSKQIGEMEKVVKAAESQIAYKGSQLPDPKA